MKKEESYKYLGKNISLTGEDYIHITELIIHFPYKINTDIRRQIIQELHFNEFFGG